jgi:V8-like Glu-specific endopeptidase
MDYLKDIPLEALRAALQARGRLGTEKEITLQSIEQLGEGSVFPNLAPRVGFPRIGELDKFSDVEVFEEIQSRQKALYGDDDRQEIHQVADIKIRENSRSVAALVHVNQVFPSGADRAVVSEKTMAARFQEVGTPLCQREPFRNQPSPALGTAFLISQTLLATAGHNLNAANLHTRRVIFDFVVMSDGSTKTEFHTTEIFGISKFVDGQVKPNGADWAIVELDRPVTSHSPLKFRTTGKIADNSGVYVIGHPIGLPKKYAGNAQVRENQKSDTFIANLDTYGGNSGSPVFNAVTHQVEGILVRGQSDFAPLGDCIASLVCPLTGCRGEDCNRMNPIAEYFNTMS